MRFGTDTEADEADGKDVDQDPELREAVADYEWARCEVEDAKLHLQSAKERLVKLLQARGEKSLYVTLDGEVYKATVVAGERAKVDEAALAEALGDQKFSALCTRKVDTGLLTAAIASGSVDPALVGQHVQIVPIAAYAKVTKVEGGSE